MIVIFFLFLNALLSINNSILYLLLIHLDFNVRELLTIFSCLSSIANFYAIYKLVTITKDELQQYLQPPIEDDLYEPMIPGLNHVDTE